MPTGDTADPLLQSITRNRTPLRRHRFACGGIAFLLHSPVAAAQGQSTRYVAPTDATVYAEIEEANGTIPARVIDIHNSSGVSITVYSVSLRGVARSWSRRSRSLHFETVRVPPWSHGAMEPRAMEPWSPGAMEPWSHGALEPWSHGATEPRSHGAMEPPSHGATATAAAYVATSADARIRLGDSIHGDRIAVLVSGDLRDDVIGAPSYLARHLVL